MRGHACKNEVAIERYCRSLLNIANKKGPNTLPWGTPESTLQTSDIDFPAQTHWRQYFRYIGLRPEPVFQLFQLNKASLGGYCVRLNRKPS